MFKKDIPILKMNLQYFSEEEQENSQDTTDLEEDTPNPEGTPPEGEGEEQEPFLSITYNKEPVNLDRDRAIELAQKGMNYDKIYEKLQSLENDPRLTFVSRQAEKYGMTVEQYLDAVKQQEEQERLNELIQNNIPEDIAKEILENRKFREQYEKQQQEQKKIEERNRQYNEFLQAYPDVDPNTIPKEVWQKVEEGTPLKYAYMEYDMANMRQKVEQEVIKKMQANNNTPGSANSNQQHNHNQSRWSNLSDEEFAKQIELAKQGLLK